MKRMHFVDSVGVAPGTTTFALQGIPERSNWFPFPPFKPMDGRVPLGVIPQPRIRWDIIGVVGGGSLVLALGIGLIASALSK